MIEAINITKRYHGQHEKDVAAIDEINLKINDGEFVAITGKSGSGKSTLLYQLSLLDKPTSGEIIFMGRSASGLTESERTKLRLYYLGYVFQDYALIPTLTSAENVMVPALMRGKSYLEAREIAKLTLGQLGLEDKLFNLPSHLSGGQQQRVSIARGIANDPKILFADEPTANLDSKTAKVVLDDFVGLHKKGQTIVMVTHEKAHTEIAGRVITLSDGRIVKDTHN